MEYRCMKIKKVTKEYYKLEDGRVIEFDEPLDSVPSVKELQKMLDKNASIIEDMRNAVKDK